MNEIRSSMRSKLKSSIERGTTRCPTISSASCTPCFCRRAERCHDSPWCPAADVYRGRARLARQVRPGRRSARGHGADRARPSPDLARRSAATAPPWQGCRYYHMEIAYSHFERSLELPCDLERADITTDYRDGMLLVHIRPMEATRDFEPTTAVVLPVLPLHNTVLFPSPVPAAVGGPAQLAGRRRGRAGHRGEDVRRRRPARCRRRAAADSTTSTPSAPAPSSRRWPAARASSSCSCRASSASRC